MKNRLLIGVSAFALVASVSMAPQFAVRAAHAQAALESGTMLLAQTDEELLELQKQKKKKNKNQQGEESSEQGEQPAQAEEQPRKKNKNRDQAQEEPAQEQPAQAEEQQPRKKKNRQQAEEQSAQEQPAQAEEQQPRKKKNREQAEEKPAQEQPVQAEEQQPRKKKNREQAEEVQPVEPPPAVTTTQEEAPATTTQDPAQAEGDDQQRRKKRNQAAGETQQPAGETVTQQPAEQPAQQPEGETATQQPATEQPGAEQPAVTTGAEEGTTDGQRKKRREKSIEAEVNTPEVQQKAVEEAKQPATISPEAEKPKEIVADQPVEEIVKRAERQPQAVVSDQITEGQREDLRKAERRRRENVRENRNELLGAAAVGIAIGAAIPMLGGTVAADEGDRIVIERGGQYYVRKDESALFRYDADDVEYERLRGGRVREIVTRPNGSQIITIRDAGGYVLRREKITRDGRRIVLFDMREEDYDRPYRPVEIAYYEVDLPREQYIVSARRADRELFYETFEAPPVYETNERYTLRDIRENEQVRSLVRRVDLDTITFETGSAFVTELQVALLGDIAGGMLDVIEKDPSAVFLIEGHTDAVGSDISNMTLSDRRAEAVARILSEAYEVPPENMVVQGYGETYLKVATEGPELANRRVTLRNITPILQTSEGESTE